MSVSSKILQYRYAVKPQLAHTAVNPNPVIIGGLIFALVMSALAIIYCAHLSRQCHAKLYQAAHQYSELYTHGQQLLVNKSRLLNLERIQAIAEHSFNMMIPDQQWVVTVNVAKVHA